MTCSMRNISAANKIAQLFLHRTVMNTAARRCSRGLLLPHSKARITVFTQVSNLAACCKGSVHLQVIAHSMGTWAAYEFLLHARANGLPMPVKAFLSAMPAPDIPLEQRPWRQQAGLDAAQFQVTTLPCTAVTHSMRKMTSKGSRYLR